MEVILHKGFFGTVSINTVGGWEWFTKQLPIVVEDDETLEGILDKMQKELEQQKEETPTEAYDRAMKGVGVQK